MQTTTQPPQTTTIRRQFKKERPTVPSTWERLAAFDFMEQRIRPGVDVALRRRTGPAGFAVKGPFHYQVGATAFGEDGSIRLLSSEHDYIIYLGQAKFWYWIASELKLIYAPDGVEVLSLKVL